MDFRRLVMATPSGRSIANYRDGWDRTFAKKEDSGPGSSVSEQPVLNGKAAGSTPARGSTYLYAVVRKELVGGALLAQLGHAVTECLRPEDLPLPSDTRIVVLGATKEQLSEKRQALLNAGVHHTAILETDGVLAGVVTAIGLLTTDRDALKPVFGELRPFR
jgi:hypothetical protein